MEEEKCNITEITISRMKKEEVEGRMLREERKMKERREKRMRKGLT